MGIGIALGAGLGIVFGDFLFGEVGIGLVLGAGVGISLGAASSRRSSGNAEKSDGSTSDL
ncbi:MAG: hypothetical protein HN404_19435 [Gemmatimonadetes bacterium]|nr:hypothetical protein [Gemmatimonadota bacterium]